MLPPAIVVDKVIEATLIILIELDALQAKVDDYAKRAQLLNDAFNGGPRDKGALQVPSVGDVFARGKAFIQAADHLVRSLWTLVRVFQPELPLGVTWARLTTLMQNGDEDRKRFAETVRQQKTAFEFIRNTRNAVEHPKPGHEVIFDDYRLKADGAVYTPTIQIVHDDMPMPPTDIGAYFSQTSQFLLDIFESLLVNLCSLHATTFSGFPVFVVELEPDQRRYPHVKYAYASELGGRVVPYLD
jgi:hypothetical protein